MLSARGRTRFDGGCRCVAMRSSASAGALSGRVLDATVLEDADPVGTRVASLETAVLSQASTVNRLHDKANGMLKEVQELQVRHRVVRVQVHISHHIHIDLRGVCCRRRACET